MGGLFSSISGQFSKSFLIAALLPAAIFVLVFFIYILPMAPLPFGVAVRVQSIDARWQVGAGVALSTTVATLLSILNVSILRLYEGYPWRYGLIGQWLTRRHRQRTEETKNKLNHVDELIDGPRRPDPENLPALIARAAELQVDLRASWPRPESILPTRFGNHIRAFEQYPQMQYSIATITLWPHFVAELDKEHATAVDDAKSSVDFLVNLSCLSYLSFLTMLLLGTWFPIPFASPTLFASWIVHMTVAASAGALLYLAAIVAAHDWGAAVKAVFDLHRADVLRRFGFDLPDDLEVERELWRAISWQLIYGDSTPSQARWHYRGGPFLKPYDPDVTISRSVVRYERAPSSDGVKTISLVVRNTGETPIDRLAVIEKLGAYDLVAGSATIDGRPTEPVGTTQIAFTMPKMASNSSVTIRYDVISSSS